MASIFFFIPFVAISVVLVTPDTVYISRSTLLPALYINSYLSAVLLPFARPFCLQVLPRLSLCMFSFWFNY
jgi:hypothetical protein